MVLRVALGCDYLWYGAYVVMPLVYRLVCLFVVNWLFVCVECVCFVLAAAWVA